MISLKKAACVLLSAAVTLCSVCALSVTAYAEGEHGEITSLEMTKLPDRKMTNKIEKNWIYEDEDFGPQVDYSKANCDFDYFKQNYTVNRNMKGAVLLATYEDGFQHEFTVSYNADSYGEALSHEYEVYEDGYSIEFLVTDLGDYQARVDCGANSLTFTARHKSDKIVSGLEVLSPPDKSFLKIEKDWFFDYEPLKMHWLEYENEKNPLTYDQLCADYLINKNMKGAVIKLTFTDGDTAEWTIAENCKQEGRAELGFYTNDDYDFELIVEDIGDYQAKASVNVNGAPQHTAIFTAKQRPDGVLGDVDGNGEINVVDATAIQKHSAGLELLSDEQLALADVDGNTRVDVADATQIQKYAAGLIDSFA